MMNLRRTLSRITTACIVSLSFGICCAEAQQKKLPALASGKVSAAPDFNNAPTFIESDALTLDATTRRFHYTGNVKVTHADTVMTSASMEGFYSDDNKITTIKATGDVLILKGLEPEQIKAEGETAIYDAIKETIVLTDNPALDQKGSSLEADRIIIFLKENRSAAEGRVRVKVSKEPTKGPPTSPARIPVTQLNK